MVYTQQAGWCHHLRCQRLATEASDRRLAEVHTTTLPCMQGLAVSACFPAGAPVLECRRLLFCYTVNGGAPSNSIADTGRQPSWHSCRHLAESYAPLCARLKRHDRGGVTYSSFDFNTSYNVQQAVEHKHACLQMSVIQHPWRHSIRRPKPTYVCGMVEAAQCWVQTHKQHTCCISSNQ
jgi:hypothetical protein